MFTGEQLVVTAQGDDHIAHRCDAAHHFQPLEQGGAV
jgi:hypothetical protein